jgi:flagellar FliL protein
MASSPTVLAGTSPSPTADPVSPAAPVKASGISLMLTIVVGLVITCLVVGGVVYYLAHTGRLPMHGGAAKKPEAPLPITTHAMVLDPLLVNLTDAGGSAYLKVALTLRIADAADKKDAKPKEEKTADDAVAGVRDTVLTVLGRQTAEGLLAADGKEHLKAELKAALTEHNVDLKVTDVFFTDFLVQR